MLCKHCYGPILFTKIVSTPEDFQNWRGSLRWRIRSAKMISRATHDHDWPDSRQNEILQRYNCSFTAIRSCRCIEFILHAHLYKSVSDLSPSTHVCYEGQWWKNADAHSGIVSTWESGQCHRTDIQITHVWSLPSWPPCEKGPICMI